MELRDRISHKAQELKVRAKEVAGRVSDDPPASFGEQRSANGQPATGR